MKRRLASTAAYALVIASSMALGSDQEPEVVQGLSRYCATSWHRARISYQDWDDCTQQVLLELLERVPRDRVSEALQRETSSERRDLNQAIWRIAKRWQRSQRTYELNEANLPDTRQNRQDAIQAARDTISEAMLGLTKRQQAILQQTLDGASVGDIAHSLGATPAQISDDKYRAVQRLREKINSI